jgi:translation initiation factor IF-2
VEKIRIYDLSKKIGVSNKEIINALKEMGITGKTHSSSIEMELAEKVTKKLKPSAEEKPEKKEHPPKAEEKTAETSISKDEHETEEAEMQAPSIDETMEEDLEEKLVIPDRFKKEIVDQKIEKLRSKSLQRALQTLRKVEPKRRIEPKPCLLLHI